VGYSFGKPKLAAQSMKKLPAVILFLAVALFIAADLLLDFDFNWIDYAIVIIIALFGLLGYVKGLVNTVFSLAGYILGIICAIIFSPKVALLDHGRKQDFGASIGGKINELLPGLSQIQI
jgi:energy-coupling factor transporter transmembrane protein EcfT